ncbi:MAG TPA: FAD/NAD(P)-binding protein [Rhizomicrobium sp.]|jgi:uncharacterized NAD(P)/FAD-binding protein YdhS
MTLHRTNFETHPVVAVIGGGFTGTMFALKYLRAQPRTRIFVIERSDRLGRGLAYGACSDFHVLNVPVRRMEMGLEPSFSSWLARHPAEIAEALVESGGDIGDAFVPRFLLGRYVEEQAIRATARSNGFGIVHLRATATELLDRATPGVRLDDGRKVHADIVVVATGNLPPRSPFAADNWVHGTDHFVADPWAPGAIDELDPADPVLLLGTGLTMIDVALKLSARRHRGPVLAVSRHGLLPHTYKIGGRWESTAPLRAASPRIFMRRLRGEMERAEAAGVSWQRVLDSIRPRIPEIWKSWSGRERQQFLRHLRTIWDTHRHRMAPRIAQKLEALRDSGQLRILAGRVRDFRQTGAQVSAEIEPRGGGEPINFAATRIFNCTGPRSDINGTDIPFITDLSRRGVMIRDPLGLGIETNDSTVLDSTGRPSSWLYALGSLTRPSQWEITSVAELTAQIDRLTERVVANTRRAPWNSLHSLAKAV